MLIEDYLIILFFILMCFKNVPVLVHVNFLYFFPQAFSHGSHHIRHYGFGKALLDIQYK